MNLGVINKNRNKNGVYNMKYKEILMDYSKKGLQKEYDKKIKSYQYQSRYEQLMRSILDGTSSFTTSQPEAQLKKHEKARKKVEKELLIIKEVACEKFGLCN